MTDDHLILSDTASALQSEWGLLPPDIISEEELLRLLAERILVIIQQGPDAFFQLMYRLDISEKKLNEVLGSDGAAEKIARLVYNRQLEKIKSRFANRQDPGDVDPELKW